MLNVGMRIRISLGRRNMESLETEPRRMKMRQQILSRTAKTLITALLLITLTHTKFVLLSVAGAPAPHPLSNTTRPHLQLPGQVDGARVYYVPYDRFSSVMRRGNIGDSGDAGERFVDLMEEDFEGVLDGGDAKDKDGAMIPLLLVPPPRPQQITTVSSVPHSHTAVRPWFVVTEYNTPSPIHSNGGMSVGPSSLESIIAESPDPPPPSTVTVPLFLPPEILVSTDFVTRTEIDVVSITTTATSVIEHISTTTQTVSALPTTSSSSLPPPRPLHAPAPSPSSTASPLPPLVGKATWTPPRNMRDISPFNVTSFPGSSKNLKFVTGVPARAVPSPGTSGHSPQAQLAQGPARKGSLGKTSVPEPAAISEWHPDEVALQLRYPAGSINPAQKPQGGAEFYASPLDLQALQARNVTLRYSVYFPDDFDWVLAGKLPGLYGGHTGCSGGNAALDCFSTRLMWRSGGVGELYLYAAKDKQTRALCADKQSVCDAAYGFSIGRGSFVWVAGQWTTVEQTVVLNTPGKQDGAFTLRVNGEVVLDRDDVFYRDVLWPGAAKPKPSPVVTHPPPSPAITRKPVAPPVETPDDPLGDILGPLLSQIGKLLRRNDALTVEQTGLGNIDAPAETLTATAEAFSERNAMEEGNPAVYQRAKKAKWSEDSDEGGDAADDDDDDDDDDDEDSGDGHDNDSAGVSISSNTVRQGESIGFLGIFFSTFFGGHDDKYATPHDQYVWFKDWALACND